MFGKIQIIHLDLMHLKKRKDLHIKIAKYLEEKTHELK